MTTKQLANTEFEDTFELLKEDVLNNINCIKIGIIESFNAANQTATIKVVHKRLISTDFYENKTWQDYPILLDCPCMIFSGGDGSLEMPITKGDECIILFNDRELDNWFESGEISSFDDERTHALSDGIAIVGIKSLVNSISGYSTDKIRLKYKGNYITISELILTLLAPTVAITAATALNITTASLNIEASGGSPISGTIKGDIIQTGDLTSTNLTATGNVRSLGDPSGTFTTTDGKTITVTNGVITAIV
jgi:hypothetical protein